MPNPNDPGPPLTPDQQALLDKFVSLSTPVTLQHAPGLGKTNQEKTDD